MNRFIIADASKCIGCRTCEVACVVSHQENQDCAALTPKPFTAYSRDQRRQRLDGHRLPSV
jgi:Fe-S-cluster-containing hydrogenase component 2